MSEFAQEPGPPEAVQGSAQDVHERDAEPFESGAEPAADGEHAEEVGEYARDATEESDEGPSPLGIGVRPTGHGPVDTELRRLEDADHLAVSGHLEVYEDVHRGLRETLAALDRPHTSRS